MKLKTKHYRGFILFAGVFFVACLVWIWFGWFKPALTHLYHILEGGMGVLNEKLCKYRDGFGTEKPWHEYIDVIYYINLDTREDRKTEFLQEMERMGIPDKKIMRISAVHKLGKGDWGCSLSHLSAIQKFIDTGKENCIVFEDDFSFTQDAKTVDSFIRYVFEQQIAYDVIMLSANEIKVTDTEYTNLKKVHDAQTAAGYMVNKRFAPILLQNYREGARLIENSYKEGKSDKLQGPFCVDQYWKRLQPQSDWYMFSPKLGAQRKSHSDIQGGVVDYGV
jgi:hypothetical protein